MCIKAPSFIVITVLALSSVAPSAAWAQDNNAAIRDITDQHVDTRQLRAAVASRTLTWLTGSSANNDYISVGRTANFFGFVALRVSSGQSLTRSAVAQDTLAVLDTAQTDQLVGLLTEQQTAFERTQDARHRMNRALEGLLVGEEISRDAFLDLGRIYGASEAELGRVIGQRLGSVAQTLTQEQQSSLAAIRNAHVSGQGHSIAREPARLRLSREDKQELVNIAARLLSWTTGTPAFNDFEVVGKPSQHFGFVSLRIDSNHGVRRGRVADEVWALLTADQHEMLNAAVSHNAIQFEEFLAVRGQLMRALEAALSGQTIDPDLVAHLGAAVGALEADMTWAQATAMLAVRNSLSDAQSQALLALRAKYTSQPDDALTTDPVERGRQLFAQCILCHEPNANSRIAPDLSGIIGRTIAGDAAFDAYSPALQAFSDEHLVWDEAFLDRFLASPRTLVPGTSMGFDGLEMAEDRAALIAYLKQRQ